VTLRAAVPVLDKVTVWAALVLPAAWPVKVSEDGLSEAAGIRATPVPLRAAVCGDPDALSVTVSVPVRAPAAVGVKVTEIVQLPLAATDVPQVLLWAKSPETAICVIVKAAVPAFERVTV
jgi:hypothetical protein